MSGLGRGVALAVAFCALTVAMTWPLLSPGMRTLPDSDDAFFSVWRLAWVAHQLPNDPQHLFDGNMFHPAKGTLAFSDAMLLVSAFGAPLMWLGVDPGAVHNLLLGAAFVSSMWFAFLLVRDLTGSPHAAWLAAIVFGFAPYRFAHIGHLELQWVMWMPLSLWLLHRFIREPSPGRALAIGAATAGQTLCSLYYGVFLAVYLGAAGLALMFALPSARRRVVLLTPLVVLPLLVVGLVYGPPYARTRAEQGARNTTEITEYSAQPADFLRVPPLNWLRGTPNSGNAPDERSLYPGLVALVLAVAAFMPPVTRVAWVYLILAALSIDATLGMNGVLFPLLQDAVPPLTSLRSPARFGALVLLTVSVLAGIGAGRILTARPRRAIALVTAATVVALVEFWSAPVSVRPYQDPATEAHKWLASQPPGTVVVELPMPTSQALWLYETTYLVRSAYHWQPLVNGYSGFAPEGYRHTLERIQRFPDAASIARLQELGVRYVLINRARLDEETFKTMLTDVMASPAFWPPRPFGPEHDQVVVVEMKDYKPQGLAVSPSAKVR